MIRHFIILLFILDSTFSYKTFREVKSSSSSSKTRKSDSRSFADMSIYDLQKKMLDGFTEIDARNSIQRYWYSSHVGSDGQTIRVPRMLYALIRPEMVRDNKDFEGPTWDVRADDLGGLPNDEKGELVFYTLGGPLDWYNFAPRSLNATTKNVPNTHKGQSKYREISWIDMEGEVKSFLAVQEVGRVVSMTVVPEYNREDRGSLRPTGFRLYTQMFSPSGGIAENLDVFYTNDDYAPSVDPMFEPGSAGGRPSSSQTPPPIKNPNYSQNSQSNNHNFYASSYVYSEPTGSFQSNNGGGGGITGPQGQSQPGQQGSGPGLWGYFYMGK